MTRFTRPEDERPHIVGGIADVRVALGESHTPYRSLLDPERHRDALDEHRATAARLTAARSWPGGPDRIVDVLARLLCLGDPNGWYYGDLFPLAGGRHMRVLWAILGELVEGGQIEVAFLSMHGLGAQSEGWESPQPGPRSAVLRQNGGSHSEAEWTALRRQQGDRCLCCAQAEPEVELTKDHVVPVSLGGPDSLDNLQVLCRSCNTAKGTQIRDYRPLGPAQVAPPASESPGE